MPPRAEHLFFPIRKRTAAPKIVQQSFFRARLRKILLSGCFSAIFINNIQRGSNGEVSINFGYRGSVIPLRVFDTKVDRSGRVVTRVKKSGARQALDHAFEAKMGSHYGIYERQGEKRFPVKELFGPATPQMMYSNENVMDSIEAKMASTYEERIEHEITRVLNGWGV